MEFPNDTVWVYCLLLGRVLSLSLFLISLLDFMSVVGSFWCAVFVKKNILLLDFSNVNIITSWFKKISVFMVIFLFLTQFFVFLLSSFTPSGLPVTCLFCGSFFKGQILGFTYWFYYFLTFDSFCLFKLFLSAFLFFVVFLQLEIIK